MKKVISLLLAFVMTLALSGCKSSDYKKAAELYEKGKYDEAAESFEALGAYRDSADMAKSCQVENCVELIDAAVGWSVENHFDEYKAAFRAYDKLGEELKPEVRNAGQLLAIREEYERIGVEIEIKQAVVKAADSFVKDFVEDHLDALRDSYERYDKKDPFVSVKWDESRPGNIYGQVSFDISYENSYGRTIETDVLGSWEGSYINGKITISDDMDFPGLKLAFLDRFHF